jgi:hypothetical protein
MCVSLYDNRSSQVVSIVQTGVTWTLVKRKEHKVLVKNWYVADEIWMGIVGAGAAANCTINTSDNEYMIADGCEYSGLATSGTVDKSASNEGDTVTTTDTGTTPTTLYPVELWVGSISIGRYPVSGDTTQSNPANGFSLLDGASGLNSSLSFLEKIVSATGTAESGTTVASSRPFAGCIATFKTPIAAPTVTTQAATLIEEY